MFDLACNLLCADDIALLAEDLADLQIMLTDMDTGFRQWGLQTNVHKTKVMSIDTSTQATGLHVGGQIIEAITTFKY